jgi:thymidylate synthase (FAD)
MKVDYIDHLGTDLTVANAARVSFHKESDWEVPDWDGFGPKENHVDKTLSKGDAKLIKYLADHNHWSPFSHCMITLREKVPIFVARQIFKHQVGFARNEVSRRYVDEAPDFYTPDVWRKRAENKKQGSSEEEVNLHKRYMWTDDPIGAWDDYTVGEMFEEHMERTKLLYNRMIEIGVAPEQARMVLPQSMYTEFWSTGSLYAWARAYKLRSDSHSQKESQYLAAEWDKVIRPLFPISWSTLVD